MRELILLEYQYGKEHIQGELNQKYYSWESSCLLQPLGPDILTVGLLSGTRAGDGG